MIRGSAVSLAREAKYFFYNDSRGMVTGPGCDAGRVGRTSRVPSGSTTTWLETQQMADSQPHILIWKMWVTVTSL